MLNSNNGWIKISRSISEHWLWDDTEMLKWWLDFIILAAWKPRKVLDGGELIELQRGQFISSTRCLQIRWAKKDKRGNIVEKPSLKRVTHFLQLLEAEKMITRSFRKHQTTVVTVCNYASYQITDDECYNTLGNTLRNTLGNTLGNKIEEYEEYKEKEKPPKGGKKKSELFFLPPTQEEVDAYVAEKGLRMDGAAFFDHFTANGWKVGGKAAMRDWKAAVRNWARNQPNFERQTLNDDGTTKTDRQRAEDEYNAEFERYVRAKLAGDGVQE